MPLSRRDALKLGAMASLTDLQSASKYSVRAPKLSGTSVDFYGLCAVVATSQHAAVAYINGHGHTPMLAIHTDLLDLAQGTPFNVDSLAVTGGGQQVAIWKIGGKVLKIGASDPVTLVDPNDNFFKMRDAHVTAPPKARRECLSGNLVLSKVACRIELYGGQISPANNSTTVLVTKAAGEKDYSRRFAGSVHFDAGSSLTSLEIGSTTIYFRRGARPMLTFSSFRNTVTKPDLKDFAHVYDLAVDLKVAPREFVERDAGRFGVPVECAPPVVFDEVESANARG